MAGNEYEASYGAADSRGLRRHVRIRSAASTSSTSLTLYTKSNGQLAAVLSALPILLVTHFPTHNLLFLFLQVTMPVQDRTNEFRACVESIRNRSSFPARGAEQKQRLLQQQSKGEGSKSEFTRMASAIGKDISSTTLKLGKLAQRELPLSASG